MKLWQTALAVGIAGTVAYVGYRVVKRASLQGPIIRESDALNPQDAPIPVSEQVKVLDKGARPSLDMRVSRDIPLLRGDIASRFSMRDSEPPSFMPLATVDVSQRAPMPLLSLLLPSPSSTEAVSEYGRVQARSGETPNQALSRLFAERPDVARAHGY